MARVKSPKPCLNQVYSFIAIMATGTWQPTGAGCDRGDKGDKVGKGIGKNKNKESWDHLGKDKFGSSESREPWERRGENKPGSQSKERWGHWTYDKGSGKNKESWDWTDKGSDKNIGKGTEKVLWWPNKQQPRQQIAPWSYDSSQYDVDFEKFFQDEKGCEIEDETILSTPPLPTPPPPPPQNLPEAISDSLNSSSSGSYSSWTKV